MELYKRIIERIDSNIIFCLVPIILTLILVDLIFKNRFETKKVLNLVRWTIIIYTLIILTFYIINTIVNRQENSFINRITASYFWLNGLMFLTALVLPFTLLVKKLGASFWYVLLVSFSIKFGSYFERFVIFTTSFHRNYAT